LGLNPRTPEFWDSNSLESETRRQLYICHTCRLCWNLCPYFPALFDLIDKEDGDLNRIRYEKFDEIVDLCYQCKLCYVKCPYKPPHEFEVDIPRLLLRAKAVRTRLRGVSFQDKFLGDVDTVGRIGSKLSRMVNWSNRNRLNRKVMHKLIGVHRDRLLPLYYGKTFEKWWAERPAKDGGARKVALFYTCTINYNCPGVGAATVQVLEKNGFQVICPRQRCCGMPMLDGGDMKKALKNAEVNITGLAEAVRDGCKIVSPGPTCSYVLKKEYPEMIGTEEAKIVAENTYDFSEFLLNLRNEGRMNADFVNPAGKIAYHMPCHSKAQGVGYKTLELLRLLPGARVHFVDKGCSGMDGTWGMKKQFFELSLKVGGALIRGIKEANAEFVVTDCPLAGLQVEQGTGLKPLHPAEVLQKCYGIQPET